MSGRMTGPQAALLAARAQGCTCNPDLRKRPDEVGGFPVFDVCHDDWCPLLQYRADAGEAPQFVMYRPDGGAA